MDEIIFVRDGLHEMASTFPTAPNNLILQLILGDVSVILPNRDDKLVLLVATATLRFTLLSVVVVVVVFRVMYKQKYEQFKMVNVVVMFILSVTSLIFHENM